MPLKQAKISYFINRARPPQNEPSQSTSVDNVESAVSPVASIPHAAMPAISGDSNDENKVVSQSTGKRKQDETVAPEEDDSDDSEPLFMTPTRRLKQRIKQSNHEEDEGTVDQANTSDDEDDDDIIKRRPRKQERDGSSIVDLDDDDDDEIVIKRRPRKQERDGSSTVDLDDDDDDDDEVTIQRRPRKRERDGSSIIDLEEEEDEDDSKPIPKRRLHQRRISNENPQEEDWKEDLEFLGENDVYEERTRGRKKSDYALALDRLKSRKRRDFAGEAGPMDDYCEHEDDESGSDESDDDDADDDTAASSIEQVDTDEEEQDDFVVDDDVIDGVKVVPSEKDDSAIALPDVFSTSRTQKFSTNFKVYVESLVYEHFGLDTQAPSLQSSVRVVERRVGGLMESLITSDAWLPEFKEALDKYPRWVTVGHCRGLTCEGCRQNRPASFQALLTFNPDDDDDDNNSEGEEEDEGRSFALGSECYKRANVYHQLAHFRSHTSDAVREEIESYPSMQSSIEEHVSNIIGTMHSDGFMSRLYTQVRQTFREAQLNYMKKKATAWITDESSEGE